MQPLRLNPRLLNSNVERRPTRDGYGDGLVEAGELDERVVVLTGDLAESTRCQAFQQKFPSRFIECGVAEQNMLGVAAGLALAGKIPFVSSYAVFMPGRAWDQLRVSVCYTDANVKIAGAHSGLSVGPDGATHQALEDLAITRVLPGLTVVVPCDYYETKRATLALAKLKGPTYFRFAREKTPLITTERTPFEIGRSLIFRSGSDVTIAACGPLVYEALLAAEQLAREGLSAEVINCHTLKPFDDKMLLASLKKTGACVTVEEHQIIGGLYGAVSEVTARSYPVPIEAIGMPNSFGESGEPQELLTKYGLTTDAIMRAAKKVLKRK